MPNELKKAKYFAKEYNSTDAEGNSSVAADMGELVTTLGKMLSEAPTEMKPMVQELLNTANELIDSAQKFGKKAAASVTATKDQVKQRTTALSQKLSEFEKKLLMLKIQNSEAFKQNLAEFDQKWSQMFDPQPGTVKSYEEYINKFLNDIQSGNEMDCLAKAMTAAMLRDEGKKFDVYSINHKAKKLMDSPNFRRLAQNRKLAMKFLKEGNVAGAIAFVNKPRNEVKIKTDETAVEGWVLVSQQEQG